MPWYTGPTILETVDLFRKELPPENQPLRLPVQDVYKFNRAGDDRRIIAGRIEAGEIHVGDEVVFSPSGKRSHVASIESFSAPETDRAAAPRCVGLTLTEQIFIDRGEVISHIESAPRIATRFRANIFWMGRAPMVSDRWYTLKLATRQVEVKIHELLGVLDASELDGERGGSEIRRHDVGEVVFETRKPVAFDLTHEFESTGRFVIVAEYDVVGGGIILDTVHDALSEAREDAKRRDFEWVRGEVDSSERETRFGHRPALVLFTGDAGVGKALIARELERTLFKGGATCYLLDARNVFLSADRDTVRLDKDELVRRYGEVAHLFMDAGHVVISTSNTFGLADHKVIHGLVGSSATVITVHVGGGDSVGADLILKAGARPAEAVSEIGQLLRRESVLLGL
jgi:bifunctional enzyme CysN/CysC